VSLTTETVLEGMPGPEPLRLLTHQGETVVLSGRLVLFRFAVADIGMRRLAMVALTQAGQSVKAVAQAFEVHPNYLSTLRKTAREEGSAGLVKAQGRPVKLTPAQREQVRRWSEQGVTGQEIARRLQVSDSMISRLVGAGPRMPGSVQDEFPGTDVDDPVVDDPVVADRELPIASCPRPSRPYRPSSPATGWTGVVVGSSWGRRGWVRPGWTAATPGRCCCTRSMTASARQRCSPRCQARARRPLGRGGSTMWPC
jgi:transposase